MGRMLFLAVALLFTTAALAGQEEKEQACKVCRARVAQKMIPCLKLTKADEKDSCRSRAQREGRECAKDNDVPQCDLDVEK